MIAASVVMLGLSAAAPVHQDPVRAPLERAFARQLQLPGLEGRLGFEHDGDKGLRMSFSLGSEVAFTIPGSARVPAEELAAREAAVAANPDAAEAHLDFADALIRDAESIKDKALASHRAALHRRALQHRIHAERILRAQWDLAANDDVVLLYARSLEALGRHREAISLLQDRTSGDHPSWRVLVALARLVALSVDTGAELDRGTFDLTSDKWTVAERLLVRAIAIAPGESEPARALDRLHMLQWFQRAMTVAVTEGSGQRFAQLIEGANEKSPPTDPSPSKERILSELTQRAMGGMVRKSRNDAARSAEPLDLAGRDLPELLCSFMNLPTPSDLAWCDAADALADRLRPAPASREETLLISLISALLRGDRQIVERRIADLLATSPQIDLLFDFIRCLPARGPRCDAPSLRQEATRLVASTRTHVAPLLLGWRAHQLAEMDLAANLFRTAIARDPSSPHSHLGLGLTLAQIGSGDAEATAALQAVVDATTERSRLEQQRALAHAGMAWLAWRAGDADGARQRIATATKLWLSPALLFLQAELEREAMQRLAAAESPRGQHSIRATRILVQALEAAAGAPRAPVDRTQQIADHALKDVTGADWTPAWSQRALQWLREDGATGAAARDCALLGCRVLTAMSSTPAAERLSTGTPPLLEALRQLRSAGELSDPDHLLLAKATLRSNNLSSEELVEGLRAAEHVIAASNGADLEACRIAALLMVRLKDREKGVALLERAEATAHSIFGEDAVNTPTLQLEATLLHVLDDRRLEPVLAAKRRLLLLRRANRPTANKVDLILAVAACLEQERADDLNQALRFTDRAVAENSGDPACRAVRSIVLHRLGNATGARADLDATSQAIRELPEVPTRSPGWLVIAALPGASAWIEMARQHLTVEELRYLGL